MIMADVFALFGTLLALGIALPGLLLTWQLLLPNVVSRAQQRLNHTKEFFLHGLMVLGVFDFSAKKQQLIEKELAKEKYKKQMEENR